MASYAKEKEAAPSYEKAESSYDPGLATRLSAIRSSMAAYRAVMQKTGHQSHHLTRETEEWVNRTKLSDDADEINNISSREEFFDGFARDMMRSALEVHSNFTRPLANAYARKLISKASHDRWMQRYFSENDFHAKEYWVNHQFPAYVARWEKAAAERRTLLTNPNLKMLKDNPAVAQLSNENTFVDMHYDRRVDLLAKVRALLAVERKDKGTGVYKKLHDKATGILRGAVAEGAMSGAKIGTWLERIFKSSAQPAVIEQFLNGGPNSLPALIGKWRQVRAKYDDVCRKGAPLKNPAVGMYIIPPERFLSMHYAQRKSWVEEAEHRINDAVNIDKEEPVFIQIRHALDLKEWDDAERHMKTASGMKLSEQDAARLSSMKRYLMQMRTDKKQEKGKDGKPKDKIAHGKGVCNRINEIVGTSIPASFQPVVMRLLRSDSPNRGIHQLRWIIYNNKWCRDHNFLDFERSKAGASKESSERTNERVRKGIDTGRRQDHVLNSQNSGQQHMRTNDFAKRRATLTHVDIGTGSDATETLGVWLEKPQHPRDLYWRTLCIHDNGMPMSEGYHDSLFANLTELRSLTQELEKSGLIYNGQSAPLSKN
ncbi:MAG TPA: hypothetical protein PKV72_01770 [Candidatus Peribacteria bacterium]|nr:hypothetical protein [Candidatus Peribacteria bacterium]